MGYYKIKNLTNKLDKRDVNKNKIIDVNLNSGMRVSNYKISVNDVLYIEFKSIPVELHKERMKGYISIVEISKNEFLKHTKKLSLVKNISKKNITPKKEIISNEKKTVTTAKNKRSSKSLNKTIIDKEIEE